MAGKGKTLLLCLVGGGKGKTWGGEKQNTQPISRVTTVRPTPHQLTVSKKSGKNSYKHKPLKMVGALVKP